MIPLELGFVLIFMAVYGLYLVLGRPRAGRPAALRPILALDRLPGLVNASVESGRRLHLSLGSGLLGQPETAATLAGLNAALPAAAQSLAGDRPPVITSADGSTALLAGDALRAVYRQQNAADRFDPAAVQVPGLTPLSFSAALGPLAADEAAAGSVVIGALPPEAALLAEASQRAGAPLAAGSDNLTAQAVLYAAADHTLLGEDVYAAGAYLSRGPAALASLRAQDAARALLAAVILIGAALKTLGLLP